MGLIDVEKCSVESSVKTDEKKSHAMLCFENLQNGTHVLCGSEKEYFILYDTITKKSEKIFAGHRSSITTLINIGKNKILSCSFGEKMKIYKF